MTNIWKQRCCRYFKRLAREFIDDCHRLGKNMDRVIVKFTYRKGCKQVLQVKKELKDLTADDPDLPQSTKIFLNQSLCPNYRIDRKLNAYKAWVK